MLTSLRPSETALLVLLALGVLAGLVTGFTMPEFYTGVLSREDGLLEWITAIALFAASAVCITRALTKPGRTLRFTIMWLLAGLVLLFGAGEEISWGQRVIGWSSGEFWQENNAQAETNLHNLMVGEVKINRILFGVVLTTVFAVYFLVLPFLLPRAKRLSGLFDAWFIPVPRARHGIAFLIAIIGMSLLPSDRAPELGEFAVGLLLAAVILNPGNRARIL